ncbi:hypothetical protein XENTR_v10007820 [Xenopus tropicalis]|nr:hypothetical protein XENTR_v10007820 [Xenopus tropicalis]
MPGRISSLQPRVNPCTEKQLMPRLQCIYIQGTFQLWMRLSKNHMIGRK